MNEHAVAQGFPRLKFFQRKALLAGGSSHGTMNRTNPTKGKSLVLPVEKSIAREGFPLYG
jgi:hypothetical protein